MKLLQSFVAHLGECQALVSTSANLHGQAAALSVTDVLRQFSGSVLDGFVDADLGGLAQPSEIRNALTGTTIRAG